MQRVAAGDSASEQAVTRVNAEQASKTDDVEADLVELQGRPMSSDAKSRPGHIRVRARGVRGFHRGMGDGMSARRTTTHGKSDTARACDPQREPARDRLGRAGWRTGP